MILGLDEHAGGTYVDTSPIVCPDDKCRVIEGSTLMYYDPGHLTVEFAGSRARELAAMLQGVAAL